MPWKASDAKRHSKKANSAKKSRQWSEVANSVLAATGDEARAVRSANAAVKKSKGRAKKARGK